jgi:hypothetical protein
MCGVLPTLALRLNNVVVGTNSTVPAVGPVCKHQGFRLTSRSQIELRERFVVFVTVTVKPAVFRRVTPCSLVEMY